ncbi:MAG TPA: hypothetical protein VMZ53_20860 [Kofleriaceae bacterium]|nr:hypothetical protein [Kofleriaceae bacterium]
MRRYLLVILLGGCAVDGQVDVGAQEDAVTCTRVEGKDLGERLTVQVRGIDTVRDVTFTDWQPKADGAGYVGFTLDVATSYIVKADFNFFYDAGTAWQNPFGEAGRLAIPIDYVDVCEAFAEDEPALRF